jgi:hypothetical protein
MPDDPQAVATITLVVAFVGAFALGNVFLKVEEYFTNRRK